MRHAQVLLTSPVLRTRSVRSPLGPLTVGTLAFCDRPAALCLLEFGHRAPGARDDLQRLSHAREPGPQDGQGCAALDLACDELDAYFQGRSRGFTVPIEAPGTPFQQRVWAELQRIPFGTTISYGELAVRVGRPGAARAVGAANGANRIAIVIPCHRVIDASGRLHGYGGGLANKRRLLELEGVIAEPALFS